MTAITDNDFDDALPVQDELASLKARADMMGVNYHPSIGLEKLRDKVNAAVTSTPEDADIKEAVSIVKSSAVESESEKRGRIRAEASELIRVRVTCMNPAKKEWEGEIFACGNSLVGTFTKFVPFNIDEGWHVPRILLNMMEDRRCQIFSTAVDSKGNKTRTGKLIKEFAIEVLPALTQDDLHELAQRQAMSKSVG
jgi:hypothetical protein